MEEKLEEWLTVSNQLKQLKDKEIKLRREICLELFEGKQGAFKHNQTFGILDVSAESKINRKIDLVTVNALYENLTNSEKACLRVKYELNMTQYKSLPEDSQLHEAVTETPSPTPVLKVTINAL
jgi:hypothetical protein